jgi:large subunit ribosomal protein L25
MAEQELTVETRAILGKEESGRLRRSGKVPGVVYGHGSEPKTVIADPVAVFKILHSKTGKNTLVRLKSEDKSIDGKKVLIREHQIDAITDILLHIDLMEVSKDRRVRVAIPIVLTGRPVGVDKGGTIEEHIRELEISCLPDEIPESISADVTSLDIGDSLKISDLKLENVKVLADPHQPFVTVVAPQKEEEVKPAEAVAGVPGEEGAVPAEGAPGAEAAAGEEKKAEGKEESKGKEDAKGKGKEDAKGKGKEEPKGKGKEESKGKK